MANHKRRKMFPNEKPRTVYNRKILRNILKKQIGSNKISQAWHYLKVSKLRKEKNK